MLDDQTLAIIGAGNIGRALIGGLIRGGVLRPEQIVATRRSLDALEILQNDFPGLRISTDNAEAAAGAAVVVLSIKPQSADAVFQELRDVVSEETLVLSVLAGLTTNTIQGRLHADLPVVRAMPNTPALVDEGATAIAAGHFANATHLHTARALFEAVGRVDVVAENLMDAVTGLSGSGPAYVYMVIEALTDGGVKQGLPRPTAARLAAQTVFGAAKLVLETGKHPAILRDEVTTPGGTAIAAVADLESHGLRTMLINAVTTATERSRQLSRDGGD